MSQVTSIQADGGYSGKPFAEAVRETLGASVQVAKRSELHTFAVMPQRWVVERSFAWLDQCSFSVLGPMDNLLKPHT